MIKSKFTDTLVFEKNKLVGGLNSDQKKDIDIYLDELLKELEPALDALEKLSIDDNVRQRATNAFKTEIEEQKWLEKLSNNFYDLGLIPEEEKTQTE